VDMESLFVCLVLLLGEMTAGTSIARAQDREAVGTDVLDAPGSTHSIDATDDDTSEPSASSSRILAEIGGGALGTALPAVPLGPVIWHGLECQSLGAESERTDEGGDCYLAGMGLFFGGLMYASVDIFTASMGVYLGGEAAGGDGSYWAALGGSTLGMLTAITVGFPIAEDAPGLTATALLVLPIVGSMLLYELSFDGGSVEAVTSGPSVAPTVAVGPSLDSFTLGVTGRF